MSTSAAPVSIGVAPAQQRAVEQSRQPISFWLWLLFFSGKGWQGKEQRQKQVLARTPKLEACARQFQQKANSWQKASSQRKPAKVGKR
jgi:hypothetical protein